MLRLLLALGTFWLCCSDAVAADDMINWKCGDIKGRAHNLNVGKVEMEEEGFTGTQISFFILNNTGVAKWQGRNRFDEMMSVIFSDETRINAVGSRKEIFRVYTLWPKQKFVFFTESQERFPDGAPQNRTFWAKCEITNN